MINQTISHYKILDELGRGGMGVVYKAEDLKLRRMVAIKFLPVSISADAGEREQFLLEAQAASALNHPNVATIYEIDEADGASFIVMEYVEGRTLRAARPGLSISQIIDIGIQVAEGLALAHEKGIVHQDIKSDNIMLRPDGRIAVMDFGLAKVQGLSRLTRAGVIVGTTAYMSPEQLSGGQVDHATDIWSLGVVLYEMLAGRLPFQGEYDPAVMYSIVHQRYPPLSGVRKEVPARLENIIGRCLEKTPSARFPKMREVVAELQRVRNELTEPTPGVSRSAKSIAVLPFADISPEMDNRYFSDGLTEEIIASLSKLRSLKVISRTSVMGYKRADKTLKQIGAELGVHFVLEGSVRKHGTDLRITAELIDAGQDISVWAEKYRGKLDQVFDIQEEVAAKIVDALRVQLTPDEERNLKKRFTANTEAYQLYLKGRFFWNKRSYEGLRASIRYFEQAIEKDPQYALAWVGLADAHNLLSETSGAPRSETFQKAKVALTKALQIDSSLAEAHASLGMVTMLDDLDWSASEREYTLAIELDPNYATSHHWFAEWLSCKGRHDDALYEISLAGELDPVSLAIMKDKATILYYARKYDAAVEQCMRVLELDPNFGSVHRIQSLALRAKRKFEEAMEENRLWGVHTGNQAEELAGLAHIYALSGREREALDALATLTMEQNPDGNLLRGIGLVYAALGKHDEALTYLERARERRAESLCTIKVDPKLDTLRNQPRFNILLKKIGLDA